MNAQEMLEVSEMIKSAVAVALVGNTPPTPPSDDKQTFTREQIKSMSPEEYQKNKKELFAAEVAGEIKE